MQITHNLFNKNTPKLTIANSFSIFRALERISCGPSSSSEDDNENSKSDMTTVADYLNAMKRMSTLQTRRLINLKIR